MTLTPEETTAADTALRTAHTQPRAMAMDNNQPGEAVPPTGGTDLQALTRALKEEMDQRTDALQSQITKLSGGVAGLSDALRKDEDALRNLMTRVQALEAAVRQTTTAPRTAAQPAQATDTAPASRRTTVHSAISGMRIVSMDSGMAWIRWKDSTWSVRQGDRLGSVTITGIDPAERTVTTTGGVIH
ncbi:TPA: conjugal transfer protein TraP [Escherichia coli]